MQVIYLPLIAMLFSSALSAPITSKVAPQNSYGLRSSDLPLKGSMVYEPYQNARQWYHQVKSDPCVSKFNDAVTRLDLSGVSAGDASCGAARDAVIGAKTVGDMVLAPVKWVWDKGGEIDDWMWDTSQRMVSSMLSIHCLERSLCADSDHVPSSVNPRQL